MSGRPDHAAARWAGDAGSGVEEAEEAPLTGVGSRGVGGPVPRGGPTGPAAGPPTGPVGRPAGGAGERPGAGGEVDGGQILADVAAISAQRDEYLESLQRLKADFDNYRKRVARLQEEQSARAEANLVGKLLSVIDNLDLAWAHLGPRGEDGRGEGASVSEEARAIAQARGQLLEVLAREGLERVDAVGVPFDPTVHDAVAQTPVNDGTAGAATRTARRGGGSDGDGGSGGGDAERVARGAERVAGGGEEAPAVESAPHTVSVDEVLRAGYRWRGQVLRPAMVRVRG